MRETLGIKNKNPLNVKNDPAHPWKGSIGTDERGHAIFEDARYSYRAGARTLQRKWDAGKRTLLEIYSSYAPASDGNDPGDYARFVAHRIGYLSGQINDELPELFSRHHTVVNWQLLEEILTAMAEFENYAGYQESVETVNSGIAAFEHDFVSSKG